MPVLFNMVATTGSYEKDGQTKYINKTVGRVMEYQGKQYIIMDPSFNPAGCLRQKDGSVRIALFEPRDNNQGQQQSQSGGGEFPNDGLSNNYNDLDDEIPFITRWSMI